MEHRRSDRRYDRRIAIEISHADGKLTSYTRNISLGGVFVDAEQRLPFGTAVQLRFQVPTQREVTEVAGQVRWIEEEAGQIKGIGIRFEGLRARDVWALNKFFEQPLVATR